MKQYDVWERKRGSEETRMAMTRCLLLSDDGPRRLVTLHYAEFFHNKTFENLK